MNSKYDQIYQNNMIENMMNSNKKINSRNAPNDANYFINNDNNYISKSFNSIDKYQKGNICKEKHNPQIKNQFNNKKYTNNIINYCLINPNQNSNIQSQSNNFFYKLENDILFNEIEDTFPKPEPTPIKIDKSTKYINISKNFDINNKYSDNERNLGDIRLKTFLHNLNLDYLSSIFKDNYINFKDLFLLTKDDFIEMKVPIGPRNKIIYFIALYKKTMRNFEMNDILFFFQNINGQNMDKITSTMPSSYNNDFSIKMKESENFFIPNHSETKRGYININKNENYMDSSFKISNSDMMKQSKNKRISKIEKASNFSIYQFNLKSNHIKNHKNYKNSEIMKISKILKNTGKKSNNYNRTNSFLCSSNYKKKNEKNSYKKTNNNKNLFNIHAFNNKNLQKNYKFCYRNSMNNFFENISSIKSTSKINLKISKPIKSKNIFNDSFLNNQSNINTNKKNKNKIIQRSKSIIVEKKFKENNFIENFKNLSSEVEIFENKYKKMKHDSYERKKKIKTLLNIKIICFYFIIFLFSL